MCAHFGNVNECIFFCSIYLVTNSIYEKNKVSIAYDHPIIYSVKRARRPEIKSVFFIFFVGFFGRKERKTKHILVKAIIEKFE